MRAYERLEGAMKKTGYPYAETRYYGKSDNYIVWNDVDETPILHADNAPNAERCFFQVHYFCPLQKDGDDSRKAAQTIKRELRGAGFDITGTARGADEKRHLVIACQCTQGIEEREG